MSKSLKKITKGVVKVASLGAVGPGGWGGKAVGALSGGLVGDSSVYGSSGGLAGLMGGGAVGMDNLAKTQMAIANQQAEQASKEARDAADSNIMSLKADLEKNQAAKAAAELNPVDEKTAEVDLTNQGSNASTRRKKYSTSSVSSGSGGPAIRI